MQETIEVVGEDGKRRAVTFSLGVTAENRLVASSKQYIMELRGETPQTETALNRDIAAMVAETYMPELKTLPIIAEESVNYTSSASTSTVSSVSSGSTSGGGSYVSNY